jgi:hypothetical protein
MASLAGCACNILIRVTINIKKIVIILIRIVPTINYYSDIITKLIMNVMSNMANLAVLIGQ